MTERNAQGRGVGLEDTSTGTGTHSQKGRRWLWERRPELRDGWCTPRLEQDNNVTLAVLHSTSTYMKQPGPARLDGATVA